MKQKSDNDQINLLVQDINSYATINNILAHITPHHRDSHSQLCGASPLPSHFRRLSQQTPSYFSPRDDVPCTLVHLTTHAGTLLRSKTFTQFISNFFCGKKGDSHYSRWLLSRGQAYNGVYPRMEPNNGLGSSTAIRGKFMTTLIL